MRSRAKGLQPRLRRSGETHARQAPGLSFWMLLALLVMVLVTGGTARGDAPFLFVLRPVAILIAAWAAATMPPGRWREYRQPLLLLAAIILLAAAHLVPLPPGIWRQLPGQDMVAALDFAPGMRAQWRPLSMVPGATANALFSLSVPAATLLLAIQLSRADRIRMLWVLLALAMATAIVGLAQTAGAPVSLYNRVVVERGVEATGLFGNRNHQAALLALMLPALAVAARVSGEVRLSGRLMRPIAVAGALFVVPLLIVTGSRAGFAVGVLAVFITLFYGLFQSERLARLRPRTAWAVKLGIGLAVLAAGIGVTLVAGRSVALSRIETASADLRPRLWASIVPILPDYQPLGSGIGSYVEVYRSREPVSLLRETFSNHAHNEYLEILLTAGLPGVALLLWAAALLGLSLWRHRRGGDAETLLARLGCTMIVLLACASLTDYPVRTPLLSAVVALAAMWAFPPKRQPTPDAA